MKRLFCLIFVAVVFYSTLAWAFPPNTIRTNLCGGVTAYTMLLGRGSDRNALVWFYLEDVLLCSFTLSPQSPKGTNMKYPYAGHVFEVKEISLHQTFMPWKQGRVFCSAKTTLPGGLVIDEFMGDIAHWSYDE